MPLLIGLAALAAAAVLLAMGGPSPIAGPGATFTALPGPVPSLSQATSFRQPPAVSGRLRVMTYNIRWGLGADGRRDLTRTAAVLRQLDADIVILNEVDVNWRRSGNSDQPARLAAEAGYPYVYFGASFRTWASGSLKASAYGNAILSRHPIVSAHTIPLPNPLRREPRSVLVARVLVGGQALTVLGTHLGLHRFERLEQAGHIARLVNASEPVILMGDFNAFPGSEEIALLISGPTGLSDAHGLAGSGSGETFPAPEPSARIDYIFVSPPLASRVVASRAVPADASDHLPVVADLDWPGQGMAGAAPNP
ncbi:MAG: endonuclease/exonuclease/phosphatase family protein [Firmicutes bacterium]|nr:endonuclease/exonuclease/phosphatase family protein [Bacillota bacterium]